MSTNYETYEIDNPTIPASAKCVCVFIAYEWTWDMEKNYIFMKYTSLHR